jgi:hypothetical protein
MKDFERQKTDTSPAAPPAIVKSKDRGHSAGADATHAASESEILQAPELSHAANAAPLADMLGQLQHTHGNVYVQRMVADMNQAKAGEVSQSTDQGQGLDAGVRTEMESVFGESFGDVRIHTDRHAESLNDALDARAVTRGRDVYFGRGEYNPATREGKKILGHELAHVVQQRGGAAIEQAAAMDQSGDAFEREADRAAAAVTSGEHAQVTMRGAAPALQRQKKDEPQKPKEETPEIVYHSKEIIWTPLTGTINAAGKFSIAYGYLIAAGAHYAPLTLSLGEGVSVTIVPLTSIPKDHYEVTGGGRAMVLSVDLHLKEAPAFQISFTKGTFTYVVTFRFPSQ